MKNKQKRKSSHVPRSIASQPLEVLRLNIPITKEDQALLSADMRLHWAKILIGSGVEANWLHLADCSNVCGIKAQEVGEEMQVVCNKAAIALQKIQDRADRTGIFGVCHETIDPINQLLEIYDQLLGLLSYMEMMNLTKEAGVKARQS